MRAGFAIGMASILAMIVGCTPPKKEAAAPQAPVAAPPPISTACPVGGTKVTSMRDLVAAKSQIEGPPTSVTVGQILCQASGDMVKVDVELVNPSSNTQRIAYKFRWFDRQGMLTFDDEAFKPVLMYEKSTRIVTTQAPIDKIADFRVVVLGQTDKMP
jgi:uncharacterized protein YcfL